MKIAELHKKPRQAKQPAGNLFSPEQEMANMELLKQELAGLEQGANAFFTGFTVPPVNGKPAQWRAWLLSSEDFGDLTPIQVDYVLRNLDWFREQITQAQEKFNDNIPF